MNKANINSPQIPLKKKATHSAQTVFPADVCADTKTDWLLSTHWMASLWKASRMNGYS